MRAERGSEAGFTLIELLVALAIFALMSVAGVTLLRSGSDTQIAVKARLEGLARTNRLANALEGDLAQAVPRVLRDQAGQPVPAFTQNDDQLPGALFGFVRAGWSNLDDSPRASLQRVSYSFEGGALKRVSWPMLDGSAPSDAAVMLEEVSDIQLRYRDNEGEWRGDWTATDAKAMPRAIEMRLRIKQGPEQRMLFLVGPQVRPELLETAA
jgi:general secretion pathway protein J